MQFLIVADENGSGLLIHLKSISSRNATDVVDGCHQDLKNGARDGLDRLNVLRNLAVEHGLHPGHGQ